MIIPPTSITNLELCIGIASKCKVNANIGANSSNLDEEVEKLNLAVKYGADTVMDLSTGGET